jgi:hypothetical protein
VFDLNNKGYDLIANFQIMVKSLIGKTLILWVHLFDSMVEIKHKPTSMQGILDVEQ